MTKRAPQKPKGPAKINGKKANYTSPKHGGRRNPPALRAHYEQAPPHWSDRLLDAIPAWLALLFVAVVTLALVLVGALPNS